MLFIEEEKNHATNLICVACFFSERGIIFSVAVTLDVNTVLNSFAKTNVKQKSSSDKKVIFFTEN